MFFFQFQLGTILGELSSFSKTMGGSSNGDFDFTLIESDDETYATSDLPLPKC